MNTILLPYAQPRATTFFEYMPNRLNEQNMSNYNEVINMTSISVLPLIYGAERRFGAHSNRITTKGENEWLNHLKLNKREAPLAENDFSKKLEQQANVGCLPHGRSRGRLPFCNIPLDNELLITTGEKGEGFNAQNKDKLTPLMQAVATHKNADFIKYLIARGADVSVEDNEGNTALMWLIKSLFRLKDNALIKEKWKIFDMLQEMHDSLNRPGTAGYTPLMVTVLGEDYKTFFKLLLNGALANVTNKVGETALHLATKYDTHWMISVVLRYGAPEINIKDKKGYTPFMLAAFRKNLEIMDFYIRRGVNLDSIDEQGWTVLMHAVNCGDVSMVEYLLSKGACVNYVNRSNETALMVALHKHDEKIVNVLSKAISVLKAANKDCRPALSEGQVPESANSTAYMENDAFKNVAEEEGHAGSHAKTTVGTLNATETVSQTIMTETDYEANTTEAINTTPVDYNDNSDYPVNENVQQKNKGISAGLPFSKSSGSSLFLSSRITGDIDKIYQSLKRIMSRRSV